jgi:hypothetical protein
MSLFGKHGSATLEGRKPCNLRLADPEHPARECLERATRIVDQYVAVELAGERTAMKVSAPLGEMQEAVASLAEAVALCPDDLDLLVAKASVLHASAQFKTAEEALDAVLLRDPTHFEARMWKEHWETWANALRFPAWREGLTSLHPVMTAHMRLGHRVQVVRDGLQKTLAIVAAIQGPPLDSRAQVKVEWVFSATPHGPLVAHYLEIIEPGAEPSITEAFLPIFQPSLYTPMEGAFLVRQLAFAPYCFVVFTNASRVDLNRRVVLSERASQETREMGARVASMGTYLPQAEFQRAVQWHTSNFDMSRLKFE